MSDPGSVQITLPRWAGVAVALFAVGMLGLLVTQIVLRAARAGDAAPAPAPLP